MRIAVIGGTGTVGTTVVAAAREAGHDTVPISRSGGVDVVTGDGLADALAGVEAVIDTSNVATNSARKASAFFEAATGNLLRAGGQAGVRHLVVLSIVGIDRVPLGYYRGKLAQERAVTVGALPWTIVRATQFHEFAGQLLERVPGPVAVIPTMRSATVAAHEVGSHLVRIADGIPLGMAPELAGPEVHDMAGLARQVLAAQESRRRVLSVRLPGRTGKAMANGGLLPQGDALRGRQTFDEWLAVVRRR